MKGVIIDEKINSCSNHVAVIVWIFWSEHGRNTFNGMKTKDLSGKDASSQA